MPVGASGTAWGCAGLCNGACCFAGVVGVVFVLFDIEGVPMDEVAQIVGCPLQTAYSRLYAARRKVEGAMARGELRVASRQPVTPPPPSKSELMPT